MPRTVVALAFVVFVVAAGVVAPVAAAAGADESASFENNYLVVTRGDSVDITVSHSSKANLTIGGEEVGFEVRVPLGGSDTDTVTLHTYETTSPDPRAFLSAKHAEMTTTPLDHALEPGKYQLTVTIDGVTQAVGTLDVRARSETTSQAGVAPRDLPGGDAKPGAILDRFTARETVAKGDHAMFLVNESGLEWAMKDESTDTRLDSALTGRLTQLDPEPNTQAATYTLDSADFRVVSNVENEDQFAVLWDTSSVPVRQDSSNRWEFVLTLNESSNLVEEDEELVRKQIRLVDPSFELRPNPSFTLAPWDDRHLRVNGTTNLAPSSSIDVRALQESPRALLWKQVVTVSENGTFSAAFTFSRATVPGSFPLWVRGYQTESAETVKLTTLNASLEFPDQTVESGTVTVENLNLSHGGFVEVAGENTTYGVTAYLEPGQYESVQVPLEASVNESLTLNATAFADVNGNATLDASDVTYNVSGTVVREEGVVIPPVDGTTPTTDAPTTTTPLESERQLRRAESNPLTPAPNQAGSGSSGGTVPLSPLLVVVALAAGALLGWRQ